MVATEDPPWEARARSLRTAARFGKRSKAPVPRRAIAWGHPGCLLAWCRSRRAEHGNLIRDLAAERYDTTRNHGQTAELEDAGGVRRSLPFAVAATFLVRYDSFTEELPMKTLSSVSFVLGMLFASMLLPGTRAVAADPPPAGKVYELRVYHANPGKLEALHARFRDHTCKLFQRHGIEMIGFWTPTEGEEAKNTLYYLIAFPDAAAQEEGVAGISGGS